MKKKFLIIIILVINILSICTVVHAGLFSGDDLTTKISNGLSKIQEWIMKIATPAAAVALGAGLLMKKFSFGDEERIAVGKKLIRSTLFSYAFILLTDPVIDALNTLFG